MFTAVSMDGQAVVKPVMEPADLLRVTERIIAQNQLVVEANCRVLQALASPVVVVGTLKNVTEATETTAAQTAASSPVGDRVRAAFAAIKQLRDRCESGETSGVRETAIEALNAITDVYEAYVRLRAGE